MACEAECRAFLTIQAGFAYIYIYVYIHICIYIYIFTKAGREAGQLLFANEVKIGGLGGALGEKYMGEKYIWEKFVGEEVYG